MIRNYQNRFKIALKKNVEYKRLRYEKCMQSRAYKEPTQGINEKYIYLDTLIKNIVNSINNKLVVTKKDFVGTLTKLDALSPLKTLARGYSITTINDKVIKTAKELKTGDKITIRFSDGQKDASIV